MNPVRFGVLSCLAFLAACAGTPTDGPARIPQYVDDRLLMVMAVGEERRYFRGLADATAYFFERHAMEPDVGACLSRAPQERLAKIELRTRHAITAKIRDRVPTILLPEEFLEQAKGECRYTRGADATGSASQPDAKPLHQFHDGADFMKMRMDVRDEYFKGTIDALVYLTESTGRDKGLADCIGGNPFDSYLTARLVAMAIRHELHAGASRSVVSDVFMRVVKHGCPDQYGKHPSLEYMPESP